MNRASGICLTCITGVLETMGAEKIIKKLMAENLSTVVNNKRTSSGNPKQGTRMRTHTHTPFGTLHSHWWKQDKKRKFWSSMRTIHFIQWNDSNDSNVSLEAVETNESRTTFLKWWNNKIKLLNIKITYIN